MGGVMWWKCLIVWVAGGAVAWAGGAEGEVSAEVAGDAEGTARGAEVVAATGATEPWLVGLEEGIAWALEGNRGLAVEAVGVERGAVGAERAWQGVAGWEVAPVGGVREGDGTSRREAGVEAQWTGGWGTRLYGRTGVREWDFGDEEERVRRGEVRVGVEQPLLKGFGRLVREEAGVAADEAWRAARRSLERRRSALVVQVVECWEGARYQARQIDADIAQARRLEKLRALADVRERRGEVGRTEVLRLDWQLGEARQRVEDGRSALEVRLRELADLMGVGPERELVLGESPLLEVEVPEESQAVAVAWRERPEVAQAEEELGAARRGVKIARRGLLPDVSVVAEKAWWGEGESWNEATGGGDGEWVVGLEGRMPLRMADARLEVSDRELAVRAAEGRLELVKDSVALEVRSALAEWRRARNSLRLARENRARADERGELARALFEAGRGAADAVSDAESDMAAGVLGEAAAERDASVSAFRLLHALGRLVDTPEELL